MAKNKNGKRKSKGNPNQSQIPRLQARIDQLASMVQPKAGKKKRNRQRKKSGNRVSHGATLANFHPFARGFLDPFGAKDVRVPDSVLVKTGTTSVRWFGGGVGGTPIYNYTTGTAYGTMIAAPLAGLSGAFPVHYSFVPTGTQSFFDGTNSASPWTPDFTKCWGDANMNYSLLPSDPSAGKSYRVAAGGLKMVFYGIPPTQSADIYCVPMFNGDVISSDYGTMNVKRIKHYRITGNDEIVLPLPMRHIGEAFEWIDSSKTGFTNASFPGDDNLSTGSVTFNSFTRVASSNFTPAITAIKAWSPQSGLGGWQCAFTLPPGAGWRFEFILHFETMANTQSVGFFSDYDTKTSYADGNLMETVANLAAHASNTETVVQGGTATPWEDLKHTVGNATLNAMSAKLRGEPILERIVLEGVKTAMA